MKSTTDLIKLIAGDEKRIDLQHRILNVAIPIAALFSLLSFISNFLLDLPWPSILISFIGVIVYTFSYIHSRITNNVFFIRHITIGFTVLLFTPILWIYNGGTMGSFQYYIPIILISFFFTNTGKTRFVYIFSLFLVTILLLLAEYLNPNLVIGYQNKEDRYIDILIGFVLTFPGILVYLNIYYKQYLDANKKLALQNATLKRNQEEILSQQTQLEMQKDELQEKTKSLEELNATKDRFFSIISHDLKNPFNSILGLSHLLVEDKGKIKDESVRHHIDLIDNASENAYKLLLNLLEWSRTQTNQISCTEKKIDLSAIIRDNINLLLVQANNKGLKLIFNKDGDEYFAFVDEHMLNAIIRNMISNAIKFTKKGEIRIKLKKDLSNCFIQVIDSGIGMKQESIDKLFFIDKSISTPGTDGETGTGLGLLLCKEFAEKNGGSISVISEENKGSTFTIKMPLFLE